MALCIAEAGFDVAVHARNVGDAEAVVGEIRALGPRAEACGGDLARMVPGAYQYRNPPFGVERKLLGDPLGDANNRELVHMASAIGAIAGGKKGAGIGAATGGVGGLIYDLMTRDKK